MTKKTVTKKKVPFNKRKFLNKKRAQKDWAIGKKENEVLDQQFYKIFGD